MSITRKIAEMIEAEVAAAYERGYNDARQHIQEAASKIRPGGIASKSMSAQTGAEREGKERTGSRAARGERDARVFAILREHPHGMVPADIQTALEAEGDAVPRSSLNVVMKRLVSQGSIHKDGRFFKIFEEEGAASAGEQSAAPSSNNQSEVRDAAALDS